MEKSVHTPSTSTVQKGPPTVESIENDREFKAHIYQQLVDLQPFLSPESNISVLVQSEDVLDENGELSGAEFALTLVTNLGEYRLEVEGRDSDVYGAFGLAKQRLVEQLDEVYGAAIDSREREAEIRAILQGALTLH